MKARGLNVEAATARPGAVSPSRAHAVEPLDYGPATAADRVRQLLNVLGALAQVGASAWVASAGTDDFTRPTPGGDPPTTPAGYAFAIWSIVFAGAIAYAIRQAMPRQAARPIFRRMGWGTAVAFLATAAWPLVAQRREWVWATVAIFLVVAWGLGHALRALGREAPLTSSTDRLLVRAPIALFLGWTSVAVFANIGLALRWSGVTEPGGETVSSVALILAATAAALWVTLRRRGDAWCAGAVAWGTIAIAAANFAEWRREPDRLVGSAALLATVLVLVTLVMGWMRRRRDPWSVRA